MSAQQAISEQNVNARLEQFKELLAEANNRVVFQAGLITDLNAQLQASTKRSSDLEKVIEELKKPVHPPQLSLAGD